MIIIVLLKVFRIRVYGFFVILGIILRVFVYFVEFCKREVIYIGLVEEFYCTCYIFSGNYCFFVDG